MAIFYSEKPKKCKFLWTAHGFFFSIGIMSGGAFNSKRGNSLLSEKNQPYSLVFGPLLNIGGTMAAGMLFFGFIGSRLDRRYDTDNVCLIIGLFIGLFIGFYETWRAVLALNRQPLQKRRNDWIVNEKQEKENKGTENDFNI